MKSEIERRQSRVDIVRAFFEARKLEWIPARDLEEPATASVENPRFRTAVAA